MILAYILSFSLLIMSVIKVADLFVTGSKNLESIQRDFIKQTRKTHEKGSITLTACVFTVIISALLMFFALKFKTELAETRYRKDSYFCFQYLNIETHNYILDMSKINIALRSAFAALFTVVFTAEAEALFKALKIARDARHLYYIKNLLKNSYCDPKSPAVSYMKNLPFKTTKVVKLVTLIDGTTQVRSHQWSLNYFKFPNGIRLKKAFSLKADLKIEGAFFPNLSIQTKEVAAPDISKLNFLSGFQ